MSTLTRLGFTTVLLIASIGIGAAQDAPRDVAIYPATAGAQPSARAPLGPQSGETGSIRAASEASANSGGLAENGYDFTNPDSIPGFGTLPPNYQSSGVMPHIGSQ